MKGIGNYPSVQALSRLWGEFPLTALPGRAGGERSAAAYRGELPARGWKRAEEKQPGRSVTPVGSGERKGESKEHPGRR